MVIGNGLLAKRFGSYNNDDRFLIFASGVSNSKTKNKDAYKREIALLRENIHKHAGKTIVYFSTCSIYDPDEQRSDYVLHKLQIEDIICNTAKQFFLFRVSNVAGRSANPNTILNYFFHHIRNGINFDCWVNACRNIIDIDDVFFIADRLLQAKLGSVKPVNIANPVNYPVKDIIAAIETFLGTRSNYVEVNKGSCFEIDLSLTDELFHEKQDKPASEYLPSILSKYFR